MALGYEPDLLPSFALPPSELTDLRILYGSCRRPGHRDPDAMVWIDDYVNEHVSDPRARPHQLFLGGDQIYADDVDVLFMLGLMDVAIELIGTDGGRRSDGADPSRPAHAAQGVRADAATKPTRSMRTRSMRVPTRCCRSTRPTSRPDIGSS